MALPITGPSRQVPQQVEERPHAEKLEISLIYIKDQWSNQISATFTILPTHTDMAGNSSSAKAAGPKRGPTGVNKKSMKTRQQANQEAEYFRQRMNELESEIGENTRAKEELEEQLKQLQERPPGANGIGHTQNEKELRDLLSQLDGIEEKGEKLRAQIEGTRREQDDSEMETDEVDPAAPNFSQTREEDPSR